MLKRVPKMCITCQHYEPYHCTIDFSYIGYIYADKRTDCRAYRLSEHYRKGGKFYESRKVEKNGSDN